MAIKGLHRCKVHATSDQRMYNL
uniref:Uncharacterized protein n=1 Tax=Arundo donax TaxID=35708 RepID=A0A0A9AJC7_ARUDO